MRNLLLIISLGFLLVACNADKNKTNIELIQDMMDQISVKAQDWDADKKDMSTGKMPPANTIPRGYKPYEFNGEPLLAEERLLNPLRDDFSPAAIARGKDRYDIYCKVCHGANGHGDGPVASKMIIKPKSLVSDVAKKYKDGRLFHIITDGQGLMGSYASQIFKVEDRWKIVNYMRTLQRSSNTQ